MPFYQRESTFKFMRSLAIWRFSEKKEDSSEKTNVPKGFEKFFKKKEVEKKAEDTKPEAAGKGKEQKEEEQISEEEDADANKKAKEQEKEKEEKESGPLGSLKAFYFEPNGSPKFENWLVVLVLSGFLFYYLAGKSTSQEITYMDFVNQYLSKNVVKMITITEDKSSDMFKYKAIIETHDGGKVHLVLPQVENFLYKLDLAQREMGKVPNEFVPVKYANEASMTENNSMMNFMIGGLFLALMLQIYRSMHGKGTGKGGVKGAGKDAGKTGGGFGGGMGDIFGMGKSNV